MGLIATAGDTALIILAAFWGLLVAFLCVVLLNTFRVLERVENISGLIEQAAASPLVKIISVGAGLRKGASRFTKKKKPASH